MTYRVVIPILAILGAALRLWQFAADTSFWIDEIPVARNILDRSAWQLLTEPLDDGRIAPRGFLLAAKLSIVLFGPIDSALRLPALVSSLIALFWFWRIAVVLQGWAGPLAMALFAGAIPLRFGEDSTRAPHDNQPTVVVGSNDFAIHGRGHLADMVVVDST